MIINQAVAIAARLPVTSRDVQELRRTCNYLIAMTEAGFKMAPTVLQSLYDSWPAYIQTGNVGVELSRLLTKHSAEWNKQHEH